IITGYSNVITIKPDGTSIHEVDSGKNHSTSITLTNPSGLGTTVIDDAEGKPKGILPNSGSTVDTFVDLEKNPDGYSVKLRDGTKITFYRDPNPDSPSRDNWVTETKTIDGKVTTVYRNNDRSFNIATKNPDGTNSTAVEKPDGTTTTISKDSRGITKTTNS